jgi:four helix bundle protein
MNRKILEERKSKFHIAILKLCELLPRNSIGFELSKQLIRFAGSVGANYRTSVRA